MKKRVQIFILTFLFFTISSTTFSQNEPFNCVYNAYLFQHNDIYAVNLASGSSILVAEDLVDTKINAAAYNSADGYLWGYVQSESKTLIRIGKNFKTEKFYIESIPNAGDWSYVGDIDLNGIYHYKDGKVVYKVDLNPESDTYLEYLGSFDLPTSYNIHDWAFNAADGMLYTVEKKTNTLYRIDVINNTTTNLGVVPIINGTTYTYGAVYFDLDGNFYISANETGTIYRIKRVQDITPGGAMDSNLFAFGPASSSNDGARCPVAPVPDEDCSNGVDDDGDGLVDCDDPACSGVEACPVITPVTPGNDGGLESNNRLSEKINARNYFRKRTNYNFNASKAPAFRPATNTFGTSSSIENFIPVDTLVNTNPIVSTPDDLYNLSNAIDIYSVDYLNENDESIASILALETEDEVYEHTKYICDRLLGAQILGINTFMINEESFIKTTIKNPGGEVEHVLSFSVYDKGDSYGIESHWNLDKYSKESFYNFQIWASSVDDLYKLSYKIIDLFKDQKEISSYNTSTPPTTFVRSGSYKNGKLFLNITNAANSTSIQVEGGIRATETSETENINSTVAIEGYSSTLEFESGTLFDFGFRITGDKGGTPDDLYIADGAWGIDDSSYNTKVLESEITPQTAEATENAFLVERNVHLRATTQNYISAYKAFTPRFRAIDLSKYNTLALNTKGTGELSIIIMKDDVEAWEAQHKYTLELSTEMEAKEIRLSEFKNDEGESIEMSNVTMIVFQQKVNTIGTEETKEMTLENIQFKTLEEELLVEDTNSKAAIFATHQIKENTTIELNSSIKSTYQLFVYNIAGKQVQSLSGAINKGSNTINYQKPENTTGIYIYEMEVENGKTYKGKLIFTN